MAGSPQSQLSVWAAGLEFSKSDVPLPWASAAFGALENATEPGSARSAASGREWDVLVTKAATAMAGNYSCSVHTDRGSAASRRFHLDVLRECVILATLPVLNIFKK